MIYCDTHTHISYMIDIYTLSIEVDAGDTTLKIQKSFLGLLYTKFFPKIVCKGSNDLYNSIKNNSSFLIWKARTLAIICFLVIFHMPVILSWNSSISYQTPLTGVWLFPCDPLNKF